MIQRELTEWKKNDDIELGLNRYTMKKGNTNTEMVSENFHTHLNKIN